MSLPRLIPAALIALMPLAAGAEQAFDATTGSRIADYRAPVPGSVPGGRVPDAETVAAMTGGGALLIDAMAAPGHAITSDGAWIIAAPHQTIPHAHWLPEIGRGRAGPRIAAGLRKPLEGCTGRPLVLFRSTGCWIGWNGVQHGAALGSGTSAGIRAAWTTGPMRDAPCSRWTPCPSAPASAAWTPPPDRP